MVNIETDEGEVLDDEADRTDKFSETLISRIEEKLADAADIVKQELYDITPKRTGFTAEAWTVIPIDLKEFVIYNGNEPIATFLSEGTAPHDIYGDPLHWVTESGEDVFATHVSHPGTEALNLEETALSNVDAELEELWNDAINEAIEDAYEGLT